MGGWVSQCTKQDHIDAKTSVNLNTGVTVADSKRCTKCSLSFPAGNTTAAASLTRDMNTLVLRPFAPFAATFDDKQFSFSELRLFYPAPIKIEGVQADAVLQCVDGDSLMIFIPLKKSDVTSPSLQFLSPVVEHLTPLTADGLGAVDSISGQYKQLSIATGQTWSISTLVSGTDPYFTWTNSALEQYTRRDGKCDRYIGWRSTPGPKVIYFQNPVGVLSADILKLMQITGPVLPSSVLKAVTNPMYSPGVAVHAAAAPTPKPTGSTGGLTMYVSYVFSAFFVLAGVTVAVLMIRAGIGKSLSGAASDAMTGSEPKAKASEQSEQGVFAMLEAMIKNLKNMVLGGPAAQAKAAAGAAGAAASGVAAAATGAANAATGAAASGMAGVADAARLATLRKGI